MSETKKALLSLFVLLSWGTVVGTIAYYEKKEPTPCPICTCECDKAFELAENLQIQYGHALSESYRYELECKKLLRECETTLDGCVKRFQKTVKSPKAIR